MPEDQYRGRFAPSPTGPLHFGSLVAAAGSYLRARAAGGEWLLRMDDIDTPRNVPGAADGILRDLENLGFEWDGPVVHQSDCLEAYADALAGLRSDGLAYPCACSRAEVRAAATATGLPAGVYPGTCRNGTGGRPERSVRLDTRSARIAFTDGLLGAREQDVAAEVGDFVIRRADGLFAYQLAVVVDDAAAGITEVVRGSDLLDSTPRQIHLFRQLGLPAPAWYHLPIAVTAAGDKLSKQTGATPVGGESGPRALWQALAFLGQTPPAELFGAPGPELLAWAEAHWDPAGIPTTLASPAPTVPGTDPGCYAT
ncbi:glutamyl-Q tRNA(Asp) synthetase [Thiohalospira halophila DSM 15071]|uniref:Glutamyl-Q tRNA(Asp) synthetase n=1 Tax=Thiohalospira halophila DSM 15071 TaxID=1123397 RepID=A0A1I1NDB2_9GAMM|nr:tRNA glutamyl-Q(34) synthetase GluQRS [Thiohalospira halophila]SFC95222.1 glutamyl-Q tRNA(Asp) synthetase [Thiohalospira halophila DSM 15071]